MDPISEARNEYSKESDPDPQQNWLIRKIKSEFSTMTTFLYQSIDMEFMHVIIVIKPHNINHKCGINKLHFYYLLYVR